MKLTDITYIIPDNGSSLTQYIVFDKTEDLSIEESATVTENPIDATRGASMQNNRIVELKSLGLSGSFGERNTGRNIPIISGKILFLNIENRLETIVEWFEKAIEDKRLFTVCKKGVLHNNQLLNSLKWTFDDSNSKISLSLSFIEVVMVERAEIEGSTTIVVPRTDSYNRATSEKLGAKRVLKSLE